MTRGRRSAAIGRLGLVVLGCGLIVGLAGCQGVRESFGIGRKGGPDEFTVVSQAPLVVPPDVTLRPPEPGAPRPQEPSTSDLARERLVAGSGAGGDLGGAYGSLASDAGYGGGLAAGASGGGRSAGEQALLAEVGTDRADPNVRRALALETGLDAPDESFVDMLLFWQDPEPPGTPLDARAEAQRIQQNQAAGRPVTAGETPIIERRRRAPLEGLF